MTRVIRKQLTINTSIKQAWALWTEASHVEKWFAPKALIEPFVGGRYELYFVPGNLSYKNTEGCRILKFVPEEELTLTWKGPHQFAELMNQCSYQTTITIRMKKMTDFTTCIKIFHDGFKEEPEWDAAYDWHELTWSGILNQLQNELENPVYLLGYSQFPTFKATVSCAG